MGDTILDLIGAIYDCALAPELWLGTLEKMGDALGGAAFVTSVISRSDGIRFIVTSRQDALYDRMIAEHYSSAATNPLIAAMSRLSIAEPVPRAQVYSDAAYFQCPLWNDVFRPQNLAHQAIACALRTNEYLVPIGVLRPLGKAAFSDQELMLLSTVLPHMQRAVNIALRTATLESSAGLSSDSMDRLPIGLLLVDARCRVLRLNSFAQQLVSRNDGLRVRNGLLAAEQCADRAALAAAVAKAIQIPATGSVTLLVQRGDGHRPYVVTATPVGTDVTTFLGNPQRRALILVSDPERHAPGLPGRLVDLFQLSRTEALVAAALLDGKRIEEIAEERGISSNTVRAQIKAVFAKTETSRQSELVRLLSAIPDPDRPGLSNEAAGSKLKLTTFYPFG